MKGRCERRIVRLCVCDYCAFSRKTKEVAEKLRKTAKELEAGTIHPRHAANRLRLIADEVRKETK